MQCGSRAWLLSYKIARSLSLVVMTYILIYIHIYLSACFFVLYFMMATGRTVYAGELLTKADLQYELMVRQVSYSDDATTPVLLLLLRDEVHRPIDSAVLASMICDVTYIKEHAGELLSILSDFPDYHGFSLKQLKRFKAKLYHFQNRIKDSDVMKVAESERAELNALSGQIGLALARLENSNVKTQAVCTPVSLSESENPISNVNQVETSFDSCVVQPTVGVQSSALPSSSNAAYAKLPHPFGPILEQAKNYSLQTLESTLNFLVFFIQIVDQVKILQYDERSFLKLLYPKVKGVLADLVAKAVTVEGNLGDFHRAILDSYFPDRARISFLNKYYFRVQGPKESLCDYIKQIKLYSRVFMVEYSEEQIVRNIVDGFSAQVRSLCIFESRPTTFEELDTFAARINSTAYSDSLAGKVTDSLRLNNSMSSAAPRNLSSENNAPPRTCYHCHQAGHLVRYCPLKNSAARRFLRSENRSQP